MFPKDRFNPLQSDEAYRDLFKVFQESGLTTALIEIESLLNFDTKVYPALSPGDTVSYLGWMLDRENYIALAQIIR